MCMVTTISSHGYVRKGNRYRFADHNSRRVFVLLYMDGLNHWRLTGESHVIMSSCHYVLSFSTDKLLTNHYVLFLFTDTGPTNQHLITFANSSLTNIIQSIISFRSSTHHSFMLGVNNGIVKSGRRRLRASITVDTALRVRHYSLIIKPEPPASIDP